MTNGLSVFNADWFVVAPLYVYMQLWAVFILEQSKRKKPLF